MPLRRIGCGLKRVRCRYRRRFGFNALDWNQRKSVRARMRGMRSGSTRRDTRGSCSGSAIRRIAWRTWQQAARERYRVRGTVDFLCEATPGAGKTAWTLGIARDWLHERQVQHLVIVCRPPISAGNGPPPVPG